MREALGAIGVCRAGAGGPRGDGVEWCIVRRCPYGVSFEGRTNMSAGSSCAAATGKEALNCGVGAFSPLTSDWRCASTACSALDLPRSCVSFCLVPRANCNCSLLQVAYVLLVYKRSQLPFMPLHAQDEMVGQHRD